MSWLGDEFSGETCFCRRLSELRGGSLVGIESNSRRYLIEIDRRRTYAGKMLKRLFLTRWDMYHKSFSTASHTTFGLDKIPIGKPR